VELYLQFSTLLNGKVLAKHTDNFTLYFTSTPSQTMKWATGLDGQSRLSCLNLRPGLKLSESFRSKIRLRFINYETGQLGSITWQFPAPNLGRAAGRGRLVIYVTFLKVALALL